MTEINSSKDNMGNRGIHKKNPNFKTILATGVGTAALAYLGSRPEFWKELQLLYAKSNPEFNPNPPPPIPLTMKDVREERQIPNPIDTLESRYMELLHQRDILLKQKEDWNLRISGMKELRDHIRKIVDTSSEFSDESLKEVRARFQTISEQFHSVTLEFQTIRDKILEAEKNRIELESILENGKKKLEDLSGKVDKIKNDLRGKSNYLDDYKEINISLDNINN